MTWTYSNLDLSTNLAQVRFRVGDTNTNDQLLTDEEINYELGERVDVDLAAAHSARRIAAQLARDIQRSATGVSASRQQKIQHYLILADMLEKEAFQQVDIFAGGQSLAEKTTLAEDTDAVQPPFTITGDDNPL